MYTPVSCFKLVISKSYYAREWLALKVDELKNYITHYLGGRNYSFDESEKDYIIWFRGVDNVEVRHTDIDKAVFVWNRGKLAIALNISLGYSSPYAIVINMND